MITNKTANFGKTRRHQRGSAGGVSGPWSKKAQAKPKKQEVNLRKVKVTNPKGTVSRITVSMKAYKKARNQNGKLNDEYQIASFQKASNK